MNVYVLHRHGGFDGMSFHSDWPMPDVGAVDVLIMVEVCGIYNTYINTRTVWYSKWVEEPTTGGAYGEIRGGGQGTIVGWGTFTVFTHHRGGYCRHYNCGWGKCLAQFDGQKRVITDCWQRDWDDPTKMDKTGYLGSERKGDFAKYKTVDCQNVGLVNNMISNAELAIFACSSATDEEMLCGPM